MDEEPRAYLEAMEARLVSRVDDTEARLMTRMNDSQERLLERELYPRLSPGGFAIIDDYKTILGCKGCR